MGMWSGCHERKGAMLPVADWAIELPRVVASTGQVVGGSLSLAELPLHTAKVLGFSTLWRVIPGTCCM